MSADTTVGERFARALLAKDWDAVAATLDPALDFRGLTPGRTWEAKSAGDAIEQVFNLWLEPTDEVQEVVDVSTDRVAHRDRVIYRFRVRTPGGHYLCEQTAYYDAVDGRIAKLRVLCSGFLAEAQPAGVA